MPLCCSNPGAPPAELTGAVPAHSGQGAEKTEFVAACRAAGLAVAERRYFGRGDSSDAGLKEHFGLIDEFETCFQAMGAHETKS